MKRFRTGPFSGDDEAQPLDDEHYPDNDEYEDVGEAVDDSTDNSTDEEEA